MKKIISALLVVAMLFSITACTNSGNNPAGSGNNASDNSGQDSSYVPENKELVVGSTADPSYWDPWGQFNAGRRNVIPLIYQTLMAPVPNLGTGTTEKCFVLASGYEKVEDSVYEVKLREGIKDTAGNSFTASDAIFCYESAKAQGNFAQFNSINSFELIDEHTFRVHTNSSLAIGDFEDILTTLPMVTQASFEASPDKMVTTPIGTSGYVLAEYQAGSHATFKKADSYWNDAANESKSIDDGYCSWWDCTKLDTIRVEFITDDSARAIALESGQIDIAADVTTMDAAAFMAGKNAGKFNIGTRPSNMFGLSFNASENSLAQNYNLRMALALCVDAQGVLDAAFDGEGVVLKAWSYPTYFDYQESWDEDNYFEYNLDLAKDYLEKFYKETGTSADSLNLRFIVQSGSAQGKIAEAVQAYIVSLVGNPTCVSIESYDSATYEQVILEPDAFDLLLMSSQTVTRTYSTINWSRQANPAKTQSGNDIWHSSNPLGQELINAALNEDTHSDETVAAYQAFVNENAYLKMLVSNNEFAASAGWISGLEKCLGYKSALAILALDYDWSQSGK